MKNPWTLNKNKFVIICLADRAFISSQTWRHMSARRCYLPKIFCLRGTAISVLVLTSLQKRQPCGTSDPHWAKFSVLLNSTSKGQKWILAQISWGTGKISKARSNPTQIVSSQLLHGRLFSRHQSYTIVSSHSHLCWGLGFFPPTIAISLSLKDVNIGANLWPSCKSLYIEYFPFNVGRTWDFHSRREQNRTLVNQKMTLSCFHFPVIGGLLGVTAYPELQGNLGPAVLSAFELISCHCLVPVYWSFHFFLVHFFFFFSCWADLQGKTALCCEFVCSSFPFLLEFAYSLSIKKAPGDTRQSNGFI